MGVSSSIEQGRAALVACDWTSARAAFEAALADEDAPEALDGLGQALYWAGEIERGLWLRERAYAGYRDAGQDRAAAHTAIQLALLHWLVHGNGTVSGGWARHAHRCLEDEGPCAEAGWLDLLHAGGTDDPAERARLAARAREVGRAFGDIGLEYDALAYLGRASVEQDRVADGMALIDETVAAVTSGVVTDPWATAEILCTMFHVCELAVDVERAEAWLDLVDGHVARTGEWPIFGVCRMHYGGLLTAAGRWHDAEQELLSAIAVYDAGYRGTRFEPVVRLADLRVRQGRLEEAARLLEAHATHPDALLPQARLHLARGEPAVAATVAGRHLERRGRGTPSAGALALLAEAHLAAGRHEEASAIATELAELAARSGHGVVAGYAALSAARVGARDGADPSGAYEDALRRFADAALPYELACCRLELARLLADSDPEVARAEARAALDGFQMVGAGAQADAAAGVLRDLGDRSRSWPRRTDELTAREREVLVLLGEGLTNAAIAERCVISLRTVEHHVSNILAKLGVANRTEAAAHLLRTPPTGRP